MITYFSDHASSLAAGVSPERIRLMGRWSSDVYQIYCRMSLEAALDVGRAIGSTVVTPTAAAFHEEQLELQPGELREFSRAFSELEEEDEAVWR